MLLAYPAIVFDWSGSFLRGLKVTQRAQCHFTGRVWTLIASAYSNDHCPRSCHVCAVPIQAKCEATQ